MTLTIKSTIKNLTDTGKTYYRNNEFFKEIHLHMMSVPIFLPYGVLTYHKNGVAFPYKEYSVDRLVETLNGIFLMDLKSLAD